jgi:restriction endonuclease Mrr
MHCCQWSDTLLILQPYPAELEGTIMQSVLRRYSGQGAKELFDLLETRKADVEEMMDGVKGLVTYTLVRSGDGGFSVTVCQDKTGIDEGVQRAKEWIAKNAGSIGAAAPEVTDGTVIAHLNKS